METSIASPARAAGSGSPVRGMRHEMADAESEVEQPSEGSVRSAAERKCCTYWLVWKPRRSAPARPPMRSSRIGSIRNTSDVGKGVCRNQPTRSEGIADLSIVGRSIRW